MFSVLQRKSSDVLDNVKWLFPSCPPGLRGRHSRSPHLGIWWFDFLFADDSGEVQACPWVLGVSSPTVEQKEFAFSALMLGSHRSRWGRQGRHLQAHSAGTHSRAEGLGGPPSPAVPPPTCRPTASLTELSRASPTSPPALAVKPGILEPTFQEAPLLGAAWGRRLQNHAWSLPFAICGFLKSRPCSHPDPLLSLPPKELPTSLGCLSTDRFGDMPASEFWKTSVLHPNWARAFDLEMQLAPGKTQESTSAGYASSLKQELAFFAVFNSLITADSISCSWQILS